MIRTKRLGHIALNVKDLKKAEWFYTEVFDLRVAHRTPRELFLRCGPDFLTIRELPRGDRGTPAEGHQRVGIEHFGLAVAPADFDAALDRIRGLEIPLFGDVIVHDDGTRSFYCFDPDGNQVEVWDDPREIAVRDPRKGAVG